MSPSPSPPSASFLVGDFLVAPDRNELRQLDPATGRPSGEPVKLTAKQMDVLVTLAAKAGQPVSKNELFDAVWPGVTVGEDNISSCIYELRKAFGSNYIQTVRNRGYLLAARVERDLPPGLLEALEPPRHEFAENLLAGVAAAEPLPARPDPPAAPAQAARPAAFDRRTIRALALAFGGLLLVVALGLLSIYRWGNFIVGLGEFENATGEDAFDTATKMLDANLYDYFHEGEETFYRVWRIPILSNTTIKPLILRDGPDRLKLRARISEGTDGKPETVEVIGPDDNLADLGELLFQRIRRVLDARACVMVSDVDMLKADHCLNAGWRLVKNWQTTEAIPFLLKAVNFYTLQLESEKRPEAARKMLLTYDQLANAYDINGERGDAKDQISKAFALMDNPENKLSPGSVDVKRIKRRRAQIHDDIKGERAILNELRDEDSREQEWRHSWGWFLHTHDRECAVAKTEFVEALADLKMDAAIRATYHSYLGDIQLDCGQPQEAIKSFEEYLRLTPDQSDTYVSLARGLMVIGDYDRAHQALLEGQRLDENDYSVSIAKGNLNAEEGNFQAARREFQTAVAQAGQKPNPRRDVLLAKGALALLEGKPAEAGTYARQALELGGGSTVQAQWLLGIASFEAGQHEEARRKLAELEQHFAATESQYLREYRDHLAARLAIAEERPDEAVILIKRALENHPGDQLFFLTAKAETLAAAGQTQAAFTAYQDILAFNQRHVRSICAAAKLSEKVAPEKTATLYRNAQAILQKSSLEDLVRRTCLERAAEYLDGGR